MQQPDRKFQFLCDSSMLQPEKIWKGAGMNCGNKLEEGVRKEKDTLRIFYYADTSASFLRKTSTQIQKKNKKNNIIFYYLNIIPVSLINSNHLKSYNRR